MRLTRRQFLKATLASSGIAAGSIAYARYAEPRWLEITHKTAPLRYLKRQLKILHLSDFHASPEVSYTYLESAIQKACELSPDVILVTGDFITNVIIDGKRYEQILKTLSDTAPTFACIGNHDGGSWTAAAGGYPTAGPIRELLERSRIPLLFNERQSVEIGSQTIVIAGLGDIWSNDAAPQQILEHKRHKPDPILVLSHNPDSKALLSPFDWDIVFCGHTHGGQLVVPFFNYRPFLPIVDTAYAEGLLPYQNRLVHVTRGLGNLHGMRINCRPEISLVRLEPIVPA